MTTNKSLGISPTPRIIACLDVKDGRTVKGHKFENLKDAGDPIELAYQYSKEGIDELVFLDISATNESRPLLYELIENISKTINIPFTIGGGISDLKSISKLLEHGADKISINSAIVKNPQLIDETSKEFGSQCIVCAIDSKKTESQNFVHINAGKVRLEKLTLNWAKEVVDRGAGEILLTSMDHDGDKNGFAIELTREISSNVSVPVIASGGAGSVEDFYDVLTEGQADAALAASIFHYKQIEIKTIKQFLKGKGLQIRI